ncbi:Zinc finger PHD-finger [Trinorchestia longiramus]|nr:Zinc finger PHD-finger [Trinorchestia longiramus]
MSHQDAWTSEAKVRIMLQTQMPEPYRRPVLSLVHHSTSSLEQLVELSSSYCYAMYQIGEEIDYKPDEPKAKSMRCRVLASRVVEVPEKETEACSSHASESTPVNGCVEGAAAVSVGVTNGQESNGADRPGRTSPEKSPKQKSKLQNDRVYDLEEIVPDGIEPRIIRDVPVTCLHRKGKPPSKDTLRLFIRANAFRPKSSSHSPWIVSEECISKYNIPSKFTPLLSTPSSSSVKRKAFTADANHKPAKIPKVSHASDSSEHAGNIGTIISANFNNQMSTTPSGNEVSSSSESVTSYANGTSDEKSNNSSDDIEFVGSVSASGRAEESPESLLLGLRQYSPSGPTAQPAAQRPPPFAHHNLLSHFATHASLPHLLSSPHLSQGLFNSHLNAFSPLYQSLISNSMLSPQNSSMNSLFSSLNSSQSSMSSMGTPKSHSQAMGRNIVIGPDGQPRKKRGRPPMTEEERARKRILQKQMLEVFQNLGVTSSPHRPKSPVTVNQFENSPAKSPSPFASPTSKSPVKKIYTTETVMKMPLVRRLLFEFRNRKTNKGFARKVVYTMDHAVTKLSLAHINLITDEPMKEALMVRYERLQEKKMMQGMSQIEREAYMKEKAREIATKRRREKQALNRKSEDQNLENLIPLPPPTPVTTFENLPPAAFCDIAMLSEFMESFSEVFNLPINSKKPLFTTTKILEAVSQGKKGYPYISSLLCTMLPTVVYDAANTHYKELGIPLREMPISYQTAPELARLCLKHQKLDEVVIEEVSEDGELLVMGEEEDELSEDLLEKLNSVELWELSAGELVAFLKALTHRCMASDALASHVDKLEDLATKIYKEKAHLKKERLKEDIELKQKKREERKAKKKPKKPPGRPKGYSPRLGMTIADFYERKETGVEVSPRKDSLLNCRQKRKSAIDKMEDEKREQEQKEHAKAKLLREERFRECEEVLQKRRRTLRITPLGYDRDHNRYWLFCNSTPGLYVEKYYMGSYISYTVDPPEDSESSKKSEACVVSDCEVPVTDEPADPEPEPDSESGVEPTNNSEADLPGEAEIEEAYTPVKGRPRAVSLLDMDIDNQTLPPTGDNAWFVYKTEEEIEELIKALADNGVREHYLKHNILNARERISRNLAALAAQENSNNNSICAVKSEVSDTAEGGDNQNISTAEAGVDDSEEKVKETNVKKEPKKEEEPEEDFCARMLLSLREDIIQIELELREGWLGSVDNLEDWQKTVQDTSDVFVLGKCLIEAQRAMHLKNLKGFMAPSRKPVPAPAPTAVTSDESPGGQAMSSDSSATDDKKQGGERAATLDNTKPQQPHPEYIEVEGSGVLKWREAVAACKTYSRLHVLVGMFDSCIKWERSLATKKCNVCRSKDKDTSPLILCEKCEKSYHWSCLRPKLTGDPPAAWYCHACLLLPRSPTRSKSGARSVDVDHDDDDKNRSSSKNRTNRSLVLEAPVSEPECCVCYGRLGLIFCCVCNAAYHSECHNPPPLTRARKDWKCSECEKNAKTAAKEQSARSSSSSGSSGGGSRDSAQTEARRAETSEKRRQQTINKPRSRTGQFLSKSALAALAKRNEANLKKSAESAAKREALAMATARLVTQRPTSVAKETRSGFRNNESPKPQHREEENDEEQVMDEEDCDEGVRSDDGDSDDEDDEGTNDSDEDDGVGEDEDDRNDNDESVCNKNEDEEEEEEDEDGNEDVDESGDDDDESADDDDDDDENDGVAVGSDEEGAGDHAANDVEEEEEGEEEEDDDDDDDDEDSEEDGGSDNDAVRVYDEEEDEVEEASQDEEEEEEYDDTAEE